MDCFWCSIKEGHLTLLEHEAAKWLPQNDLRQVKWLPADVEVIDAMEKSYKDKTYSETNKDDLVSTDVDNMFGLVANSSAQDLNAHFGNFRIGFNYHF